MKDQVTTKKMMLKQAITILTFLFGLNLQAKNIENVNKDGVILKGYDVVSYFESDRPKKGDPKIQVKQDNVTYLFSSEENKKKFIEDSKRYQPQFGGWCAYAVSDSKSKVDVDPESYLIQDGRLLLFYNGIWGDTRKKWQSTKDKSAEAFLIDADKKWPEVKTKEP